jgi:hypothetical protein
MPWADCAESFEYWRSEFAETDDPCQPTCRQQPRLASRIIPFSQPTLPARHSSSTRLVKSNPLLSASNEPLNGAINFDLAPLQVGLRSLGCQLVGTLQISYRCSPLP